MKFSELQNEVLEFSKSRQGGKPWCKDLRRKILSFYDENSSIYSIQSLAKDLGIAPYLLYSWRKSQNKFPTRVEVLAVKDEAEIRFSLVWGKLRVEFGGKSVSL